jgi:hypothetical protein
VEGFRAAGANVILMSYDRDTGTYGEVASLPADRAELSF